MRDYRRPNPITASTIYRTYNLEEALRAAVKKKRKALGLTIREYMAYALDRELAILVETLLNELPQMGKGRPVRLPLNAELLSRLREASDSTGIPATRLLLTCLLRSTKRKRLRQRRKRSR